MTACSLLFRSKKLLLHPYQQAEEHNYPDPFQNVHQQFVHATSIGGQLERTRGFTDKPNRLDAAAQPQA
jgi:hypothetical protein